MNKKFRYFAGFSILLLSILMVNSCHVKNEEGEKLAKIYCGSCHQFPVPNLLAKQVWEKSVLPYMSIYMGVESEIALIENQEPFSANLFVKPPVPLVSEEDFQKIKDYYLSEAPKKMPEQVREQAIEPLGNLFVPKPIKLTGRDLPNISCVRIDTAQKIIYAADEINLNLWTIDPKGQMEIVSNQQNAVADIDFLGKKMLISHVGKTMRLSHEKVGGVTLSDKNFTRNSTLLSGLDRLTQSKSIDLNGDGSDELLTCEFGFNIGKFSVWTKDKNGTFQEKVLTTTPGAERVIVTDWNSDKKPDILVLFAQGNERIVLYENKGLLNFEEKILMTFPPVYGSSYLDLVDFNKDGRMDLLYTCGDNADFSMVLKPYHGVYVFENQGNNKFKQNYFFPMDGAYKAQAQDFDLDGDLDIAAIGFYSNFEAKDQEDFVILENNQKTFLPKNLNITNFGRWITMDSGDIDGDGDMDIVLGNHPLSPSPGKHNAEWYKGNSVLILENKKK